MSNNRELIINSYTLSSSIEVSAIVNKLRHLNKTKLIVHISSYIHNTVLVQNLKRSLQKEFLNITVVLLKSKDKEMTSLDVFSLASHNNEEKLEDIIIQELSLKYKEKDKTANAFRKQLFSRYFTDHLTNLPNVYQLRKDLQNNEEYGLVLIKIDNFSIINTFYGFVVGDFVIEEIAKYLKNKIDNQTVYKLSGAEFAFSLKEKKSFYELKEYIENIYEDIKSFFVAYQDNKIFIDFTMASTSSSDHAHIFSKVAMALQYAKNIGAPLWIYEDKMDFENDYERNLELSGVVRYAAENDNIIPYFQAIVDNQTSKIIKYECLARLVDKKGNILSPVVFIPVAKKIKVYNQITKSIVNKSFEAFEGNDLEFSINLSIEDIMSSEIFHFIIDKLRNSSAASRVTFELLESEAIEDFDKVNKFVTEVKRYGAKIAIDDFGSGYSNFSYLIKIKANYVKIDGSLIEHIDIDKASLLVVETIVEFAKKLGMKTIAEYVHSSVIMNIVKELGIDYSQGFYIDEPTILTEKNISK